MQLQAVFFDFDGVILDSVDVKTQAFAHMFRSYGKQIEDAVVRYHLENGGVSRFEKFRYYYEQLLDKRISEKELNELNRQFSELVVEKVVESPYIPGALETIKQLQENNISAFVVSGTPEEEIVSIVQKKGISNYFEEVHGSPRKKWQIVTDIIKREKYTPFRCLFIGDSLSDYEAAQYNTMQFLGIVYNHKTSIFPKGTAISSYVNIQL